MVWGWYYIYGLAPRIRDRAILRACKFARGTNGKFENFAQSNQIGVPRPHSTAFPEIDRGGRHAKLIGQLSDRQLTIGARGA